MGVETIATRNGEEPELSVAIAEAHPWSRRRWAWAVAFILGVHVLLISYFSDKLAFSSVSNQETALRTVRLVSEKSVRERFSEVLMLTDPTLFVLAHPNGFSGVAWSQAASIPYSLSVKVEPPLTWSNAPAALGMEFAKRIDAPSMPGMAAALRDLPSPPRIAPPEVPGTIETSVQITGDLARRRVLRMPELAPIDPGLLTSNCVIHVVVDSGGDMISAVVWPPTSGDVLTARAIEFAKAMRFAPEDSTDRDVTTGQILLQWLVMDHRSTDAAPDGTRR